MKLRESIEALYPDKKLTFIVGMMKDKDYLRMIEEILPFAEKVYTVSPDPYAGLRQVGREPAERTGDRCRAF
ncbi:MAG: hypothetical protein U5K84_13600 [Alkalibacterium sp.]|nr:hypothetical protein [Alkalibacterium sp.]MDZ7836204.1 hypothetical protein [Alkalibacterium sp.]